MVALTEPSLVECAAAPLGEKGVDIYLPLLRRSYHVIFLRFGFLHHFERNIYLDLPTYQGSGVLRHDGYPTLGLRRYISAGPYRGGGRDHIVSCISLKSPLAGVLAT